MKPVFLTHSILLVFLVSSQLYAQDQIQKPLKQYSLGNLRAIAVSPDEKYLATGGNGGGYLWDFNTGEILFYLTHEDVQSMDFSPDGNQLLTGSWDGLITLYDVMTGRILKRFTSSGIVRSVDFSPDGTSFLTNEYESLFHGSHELRIWNLETSDNVKVNKGLEGDFSFSTQFYFSENKIIYIQNQNAVLMDLNTGKTERLFPELAGTIFYLHISSDGKHVLVNSKSGLLTLWNTETMETVFSSSYHSYYNSVLPSALCPVSNHILIGQTNGDIHVLDVNSGEVIRVIQGHNEGIAASSLSRDQKLLLTGHADFTAKLWDLEAGTVLTEFNGEEYQPYSLALSPDGNHVLLKVCSGNVRTLLMDALTKEIILAIPIYSHNRSIGFSPDGKYILNGGSLLDYSGNILHTFPGDRAFFTPDSTKILTFDDDDEAILWDIDSKTPIYTMAIPRRFSRPPPVFSGDSQWLFFCTGMMDDNHDSELWDLTRGLQLRDHISLGYTESAAFSPGAGYIILEEGIWEFKHNILIADVNSLTVQSSFCAHLGLISSIYLLKDRRILSTGSDGTIRFWESPSFLSEVTNYRDYQ